MKTLHHPFSKPSLDALKASDPILGKLIEQLGARNLPPPKQNPDIFSVLVRAIIGQQISAAAAKTIYQRLLNCYKGSSFTPQTLYDTPEERLRSVGISQKKIVYLKDLAAKMLDGLPTFGQLEAMEDEAIIETLTQVKGVGRWTVQMLLIFTLGRLDVLPVGDLGLRKAIQQLYALETLPKPKMVEEIAQPWQPYRSIAFWYLWRSLGI
ncbi:DNA-3-methyladenine glycosylase 2 family protein [Lusitaniella coriacea LEGE 07157]|uniref:DNA-3-methyladenine glycosylase II n=1 Tax=Lusitaniella coriacea LEGE 07157 TaxID=945747 RepID=A0A8J7DW97_9CYAN|nr:DNA-3-methyladenine glycosylase [Lusitaniella coriacea]MBE9116198.1 DNA-3-methyladenine glycosylase 2 family protein [Lusitaniella coriacea LEGE 07157]